MISVLVVEDDNIKYGRIHNVLTNTSVGEKDIVHAITAAEAMRLLEGASFDLMLLDVNIPMRLGEAPTRGGGIKLLAELRRQSGARLPRYIVGITAYRDALEEFGDRFMDELWTIVLYTDNSDQWINQIASKVNYIKAAKASDQFSDGETHGVDLESYVHWRVWSLRASSQCHVAGSRCVSRRTRRDI